METSSLSSKTGIIDRQQLAFVPTPFGTATHRPIPHHEVVNALVETLGFRHIGVVKEQYAVFQGRHEDVRRPRSRHRASTVSAFPSASGTP